MKRLAILTMLLIPTLAFSAIYKIDGTKEYVNGIPTGLSTAERAMLKVVKNPKHDRCRFAKKAFVFTRQTKSERKN
jgi:hypothetical protein